MATKAHRHSRRSRRLHSKFEAHWLLVLIARTLASIVVALVARWLHLPT
jgi:hypothetical protein